jgi:hypothetical protein
MLILIFAHRYMRGSVVGSQEESEREERREVSERGKRKKGNNIHGEWRGNRC